METILAIVCDILEAVAVAVTIVCSAHDARELVLKFLLPVMGVAKFAGKVVKAGGRLGGFEAAGELACEAALVCCRVMDVVHSHPIWKVCSYYRSSGKIAGHWLPRRSS